MSSMNRIRNKWLEQPKTKKTSFRLSEEQYETMKKYCESKNLDMASFLRILTMEYLLKKSPVVYDTLLGFVGIGELQKDDDIDFFG